jgi:hypothetical protein
MPKKNTNNYNKNYFTADGIPQPGAETDTEKEKHKLAQSEKAAREQAAREGEPTGPAEDSEIARAMGRKPGDGK